mmetsp:Transcript_8903/g.8810  ORF Transcript_8903/g.8810 Transcript_8903/m.8810 type:complete len:1147 (-) Transcript_8903:579-4019(-)
MSEEYQSGKWNMEKVKKKGFRSGSVMRVNMHNFLTFDDCEVFPGPRLNVILGPNGTGKSTITHAVCLACCGKPETVGRSPDLSQFVKQGKEKEESFTEIDLLHGDRIVTIRRNITSDSKASRWQMDRRKVTEKEVKAVMKELKIDVDNLCSFMPQDKVGAFTRNTAKENLQKTLQSITKDGEERTLYDEQLELSDIETAKREHLRNVDAKKNAFERLIVQLNAMKAEVDIMESRNVAKDKRELYQIKLIVEEAKIGSAKVLAKQVAVDAAAAALSEARAAMEPLEAIERDFRKRQAARDKGDEEANLKLQKSELQVRRGKEKIETLDEEIINAYDECRLLNEARKKDEQKLANCVKEIEISKVRLEKALELMPQMHAKMDEINARLAELNSSESLLSDEIVELQGTAQQYNESTMAYNRQLSGLKDSKQIFRQKLTNMMQGSNNYGVRDVLRAMDWMDKEHDGHLSSGRLKAEVYGPVAMHMKVADPAVAAMIERTVAKSKLYAFLTQNEADYTFVKHELRDRLGLRIDVFNMSNPALPKPSLSKEYLSEFQDIGMIGYLGDQVECPSVVRSYLSVWNNLHLIMWARSTKQTKQITEKHYEKLCPQGVPTFSLNIHTADGGPLNFTAYNGNKSRFGNHNMSTTAKSNDVKNQHSLLGSGGEQIADMKAQLEGHLAEGKAALDKVNGEISLKKKEISLNKNEIAGLRKEKSDCQRTQQLPKTTRMNIETETRKKNEVEKRLGTGASSAKERLKGIYGEAIESLIGAIDQTISLSGTALTLQIDAAAAGIIKRELSQELNNARANVQDARRGLEEFISAEKKAQNDRKDVQIKFEQMAHRLTEIKKEEGFKEKYVRTRSECPEVDPDAIEARIADLDAEIENSIDNPEVLQRYDETKGAAAVAEVELKELEEAAENQEGALAAKSENWTKSVQAIADKLNKSFSKYMEDLQYNGEVHLRETGNFSDWEMQMKVKFRQESGLVDLSGHRHSGGERAVSTVMYLMALQDLTSAPFRVVDEINQGMDERNERLVFDRIVQSCCGSKAEKKPQYFLVSPKLLQGLRAMDADDVTVLLVWNGPGVQTKWGLHEVIKSYKRKLGDEGNTDDDEDEDGDVPNGRNGSSSASSSNQIKPEKGVVIKKSPVSNKRSR